MAPYFLSSWALTFYFVHQTTGKLKLSRAVRFQLSVLTFTVCDLLSFGALTQRKPVNVQRLEFKVSKGLSKNLYFVFLLPFWTICTWRRPPPNVKMWRRSERMCKVWSRPLLFRSRSTLNLFCSNVKLTMFPSVAQGVQNGTLRQFGAWLTLILLTP